MSTRKWFAVLFLVVALGLSSADSWAAPPPNRPTVDVLSLTGVVDPFMASYVERGIADAEREGASAVLLVIDTPGGLDSSMRRIIEAIFASRTPVICYTGPSGARAASAGTFIMLACPVNAMAPGTNIGAAHPVGVAGAIEQQKVTNDAAAFIRSLAEHWGRNANWAERAVQRSVSVSAEEAVRLRIADVMAPSVQSLLTQVNERLVQVAGGREVSLRTLGAVLEHDRLGLGASILHGLISPDLAFLFFALGLVLLVIELLHPGISVPGVLGLVFLVTAFISFGELPVQLAGVVLLIASAVFFLLELKHPGIGVPTVGGAVSLILGGLLLFDSSVPGAAVSPWLIAVVTAALVAFFGFVVGAAIKARHLPPLPRGMEGLVGEEAVAVNELNPVGQVRARGETWSAETVGPVIPATTPVRVVRVSGLRLMVAPASSRQAQLTGQGVAAKGGGA
ncbi:MAG TPA: nodulation protein NfeD [Actinomycetota bacterium]|jgi:membrane-bound serine protease (ClpP class)